MTDARIPLSSLRISAICLSARCTLGRADAGEHTNPVDATTMAQTPASRRLDFGFNKVFAVMIESPVAEAFFAAANTSVKTVKTPRRYFATNTAR